MGWARVLFAALVATAAMIAGPAYASSDCASLNFQTLFFSGSSQVVFFQTLDAGEVLNISVSGTLVSGSLQIRADSTIAATLTASPGTASFTLPAAITEITSAGINVGAGSSVLVTVTCSPGVPGSAATAAGQLASNARTAITNGQQFLQTVSDWVVRGVTGSLAGGGAANTAHKPEPHPSAQAALRRLHEEEGELTDALATAPTEQRHDLERRLAALQGNEKYARVTADIAAPTTAEPPRDKQPDTRPTSFGLRAGALAEACDTACDPSERKWNAWLEGRVVGTVDSQAQSNSLGFVGGAGVDYRFQPWLTAGLAVAVENFETKLGTPGLRTGSTGLSALPYIGVRLDSNVYASAFVGLTAIDYNANLAPTVSSNFEALRVFFGGALSGVWHDGAWRFQPSLAAAWASETQSGYTTSDGTAVQAETVTYGRFSIGPEIGHTFNGPDGRWSLEPYVLARANLDISSSNLAIVNGFATIVRPGAQGSGTAGAGVELRSESGFRFRLQGAYESIGVVGLDTWSAVIRGGVAF
jgi:hypothetical protein